MLGQPLNCTMVGPDGDVPYLTCIIEIIPRIIDTLLLFAGAAAVGTMIYGAFRYATASGDPKAAGTAKNIFTYGVVGLIVIALVFAIVNFVSSFLGLGAGALFNFGF